MTEYHDDRPAEPEEYVDHRALHERIADRTSIAFLGVTGLAFLWPGGEQPSSMITYTTLAGVSQLAKPIGNFFIEHDIMAMLAPQKHE